MSSPTRPARVLVLDEGQATGLDGLGVAVAVFGRGRFDLVYAEDRESLRRMADRLAPDVLVVVVDRDPDPKDYLAEVVDAAVPVVVLTDGGNDAIPEHAHSVGAAACLPTSMPAREVIRQLALATNLDGTSA